MELVCCVQNYDWGVDGAKSKVAEIARANMNVDIIENKPYAEFWMGTHPSGPSLIKQRCVPLSAHIKENPQHLGERVVETFGNNLPFLFKILSVNKALSIQVHPSKVEAEELHEKMPHIYKDSNHKPEIAIALTEFKALCGFRPQEEIKSNLKNVPEFSLLIESEKINAFINCSGTMYDKSQLLMKECFHSLMLCPANVVKSAVDSLVSRLEQSNEETQKKHLYDLVVKLNHEFPGDIGIFCIYWLNYIVLKPGEAIFLGPNEPHAYLSGDCIEGMANSDNVVRAGLTPKLRDVSTLCNMLSYKSHHPSDIIFKPIEEDKFTNLFSPPVKDFAIAQIVIPTSERYMLPKRQTASILLVVKGKGTTESGTLVQVGSVFFLKCNEEFTIRCEEGIIIYQAFCNAL